MAVLSRKLILTLSSIALLSACDDNSASTETGWSDWFKPDNGGPVSFYIPTREYVQETQAGNYLSGQFAQYRQDWTKASEYLSRVIAQDPDNVELQQRAMVLAMQAGDANRSIAFARKVLEQDDDNVLALLVHGTDELKRQNFKEAVTIFEKMPGNSVGDFIRPILIAWAQAPQGPEDDDNLVNASPFHAYHALLIADYVGQIKDDARYFVNIIASGEVDSHIMERVGDIFARNNNPELAKKIYETLLKHKKDNGVPVPDITALEAKIADPGSVNAPKIATPMEGAAEAFYNMASILFQENSDDSALVFARMSEFLAPGNEENRLMLAGILMRNDHADEAIGVLKTINSGNDSFLAAQRSAAELMESEGKLDQAIAYLDEIYNTHKDINALIQIGDAYRRAEKYDLSIKAYDRAEKELGGKIGPENWHLLYARGMSYERAGNMTKAEADLEKALEFKPDHPYLLNYLGYSWADQGKNLDRALDMVKKAAFLRPDDGYIADSLGWVFFKLGDYNRAVTELEKAVELVPFDPTINDHLGDAYWHVGRKQEARFQWQRALNHNKDDEKLATAINQKIENGLPSAASSAVQQAKKDTTEEQPVRQ